MSGLPQGPPEGPDEGPSLRVEPSASRVNLVIATTAGVGTIAAVATCIGWSGRGVPPVTVSLSTPWLAVILLVVTFVAEFTAVRLRHGDEEEALTLLEAAMVADVLLLPPAVATVVAILGLATASLVDPRRAISKTVFNVGAHATGTALLVTLVSLVAKSDSGLSGATVGALLGGTILFAILNLGLLSWVLSVATGMPARQTIAESWRLSLVMAVGTCGIGAVAVGVALSSPFLLPFTLLPAAALTYAYRAAALEASERERSGKLVELTQVLAGRLVADELLLTFLSLLRDAFTADSARVVLEGDEESAGAVVLADEVGVTRSQLSAFDAALLARTGSAPELVTAGLPAGWGRTLIAPLESEGERLGALVLVGSPKSSGKGLSDRDLTVLSPLVSALAVALRGSEHLTRLVEETGKLQAVVDHSSDGILVLDAENRVQVWSPSMHALSSLPSALAVGRRLSELLRYRPVAATTEDPSNVAAGEIPAAQDMLEVSTLGLTEQSPRCTVEFALIRPDGEERWVRMTHNAVFEAGALAQDVVLVYDVTRERQVDRLKSDFIATVSHELRTPITPIKGYVELLRRRGEDMTPQRRREMLDTVADRVSHLTRLVEDLLLASRRFRAVSRRGHADRRPGRPDPPRGRRLPGRGGAHHDSDPGRHRPRGGRSHARDPGRQQPDQQRPQILAGRFADRGHLPGRPGREDGQRPGPRPWPRDPRRPAGSGIRQVPPGRGPATDDHQRNRAGPFHRPTAHRSHGRLPVGGINPRPGSDVRLPGAAGPGGRAAAAGERPPRCTGWAACAAEPAGAPGRSPYR